MILGEVLPEIAPGADADTKAYFSMRFQEHGVEIYTGAELTRVEGRTAVIQRDNEETRVQIEMIVFAVGAEPNDGLYDELISSGFQVIKVGDCIEPRTLLETTTEAFQAGRAF